MDPYPPPTEAAYRVPAPATVRGWLAGPATSTITRRDAAVLVLIGIGILLVLLAAVSPWFQFRDVTDDSHGQTATTVVQQALIPERTSEAESLLGVLVFILLLATMASAVAFLGLSGWLALRHWRASPAYVVFAGLVPVLLCMLAPVAYYSELPEAKMEADEAYSELFQDSFTAPEGESPERTFFGAGDHVGYYQYDDVHPDRFEADHATWGGGAGFYLCIAAGLVLIAAYLLAAWSTWRAIKRLARDGA